MCESGVHGLTRAQMKEALVSEGICGDLEEAEYFMQDMGA